MDRLKLVQRVRSLTRDFTESIFREQDIIDYINEAIMRVRQVVPELRDMEKLMSNSHKPDLLPEEYHHLLAVYAVARCFSQDERHYQATTYMNEFEVKLEELQSKIEGGEIVIRDEDGRIVRSDTETDYVNLRPYHIREDKPRDVYGDIDEDEGVEGVDG